MAPLSFAVKDAAITAGVALALGIFVAGFRTADHGVAGLQFDYQIIDVLVACIAIFIGRLGLNLSADLPLGAIGLGMAALLAGLFAPTPSTFLAVVFVGAGIMLILRGGWSLVRSTRGGATEIARGTDVVLGSLKHAFPWFGAALFVVALVLPFLPFADQKVMDLAILILTYVMLGWGLNIVVGLAGLLDLGYVAFYAVGAYAYALLATQHGLSFWICLPAAGIMAAFFGILLGFPVLRLRGDYLAIVTLGFGEIVRLVLLNWTDFTEGPAGIGGIPGATLFGHPFAETAPAGQTPFHEWVGIEFDGKHRLIFLYFLILILALITNFVTLRLRRLPVGRAWEALREDEIACRALGINPTNTKLTAFAIGAMFAGIAGSFFATKQRFISPESFVFIESAIILAIVVLGGMGSQLGVVLASILLIGLPEWFRDLGQYRMLAFGLAMVLIMVFRPRGLIAHRDPTVRLNPGGAGR
ncbi:MAG: high-affinity branched-chain amino acid ABC transporter permease LivM [Alphaproteobacteria bacterium]|nr:high-affinity branched-chain amino acid ABC transporter permease LivM [Alphaproteobacteria bacterium]MCW5739553.1 high-affinity branched-chain amino acid ABC transporter permease LivM [Alphaproteobacteria bacterium]